MGALLHSELRRRGRVIPASSAPDRQINALTVPVSTWPSVKVLLLLQAPSKQYVLGLFPSPLHRWYPPGIPEDVEFWIKRDDLTGMQLSGNKVQEPPSGASHIGGDAVHTLLVLHMFSHALLLQLRMPGSPSHLQVRKLEFSIADALAKGADTLITIGGIQSNHCRATAVAARLSFPVCQPAS